MNNNFKQQNVGTPYYPEPLNFNEKPDPQNSNTQDLQFDNPFFANPASNSQDKTENTTQQTANMASSVLNNQNIGNMLNLLKNKNGGDMFSSLLSGNLLGGQKNPMMNEVLSNIMGAQKNPTKPQTTNVNVSFEEM